ALAERLPEEQRKEVLGEALSLARGMQDEWARSRVLSALAERLPEEQLGEALSLAQGMQAEGARSSVLMALAERLPEEQRKEVMGEALSLARGNQDGWARSRVLRLLAERLMVIQYDEKVRLWHQTLPVLSSRSRSYFLSDIAKLMPFLYSIGDENFLQDILHRVQEVCNWWP
ncbi:MAG: hypothetical protein JW987_12060, partial [Anaerolineaceae bacterium]|nr:hypothetical protein [Anaerolineaceae bacterium]